MKNPRKYPDTLISAESGRKMRRGVKRLTIEVDGGRFSYGQPGWWCSLDDAKDLEGQLIDEDNEVRAAAQREARAMAKAHNKGEELTITPLAIRAVRENCGLSQRQAGKIFGGGAKAFEKYEAGEIIPTKAMQRLLTVAAQRPNLFKGKAGAVSPTLDAKHLRSAIANSSVGPLWDIIYGRSKAAKKSQQQ